MGDHVRVFDPTRRDGEQAGPLVAGEVRVP
jgi:hypothetical protein